MKTTVFTTKRKHIQKKNLIRFSISSQPGSRVYLTGTFNGWSPDSIKMKHTGDGHYERSLILPVGQHEYKFIIDETWTADPQCPQWNANEHGSLNSVLHVRN